MPRRRCVPVARVVFRTRRNTRRNCRFSSQASRSRTPDSGTVDYWILPRLDSRPRQAPLKRERRSDPAHVLTSGGARRRPAGLAELAALAKSGRWRWRGDASSEDEHAEASDARRTQAARHITMIHLHRRVLTHHSPADAAFECSEAFNLVNAGAATTGQTPVCWALWSVDPRRGTSAAPSRHHADPLSKLWAGTLSGPPAPDVLCTVDAFAGHNTH